MTADEMGRWHHRRDGHEFEQAPGVGEGQVGLACCGSRGLWVQPCVCVLVAQSCPTLCDLMDCSPQALLSMGILQARRLEWVVMPSSRVSS